MAQTTTSLSELRGMPEAELRQRISQAHQELAHLKVRASQGALERPHEVQSRRKDIARMLTIINEQARNAPAKAATKKK
jgi:ribosomal protein L29